MYKPYPIYDMRVGKVTEREPWLLPKDALEKLRDGHLKNGVLEKRKGYSFFGQILHVNTATKAPTLKTNPVMGIYNYYSGATEQLIVMDKKRINKYLKDASVGKAITTFADAGGGEVQATCTHGGSTDDIFTITDTTNFEGTYNITKVDSTHFKFTATWVSTPGETGIASQEKFIDLTRNKIRFKHAGNQNWAVAADDTIKGATSGATADVEAVVVDTGTLAGTDANGTIIFKNGTVANGPFTDGEELQKNGTPASIVGNADGANTDDEFTGDNTNFPWVENWREISYITNDNNVLQKYDGSSLTRFHIDLDVEGGPDNDVTRCKLIFVIKQRIVIFEVTERGVTHRQRGRWCGINTPHIWKDADYIDAPTEDWIVAADFIGDILYFWFERSIWKFDYTGDPDQPFKWKRVVSTEGCSATMSLVSFSDEIIGVGPTRIIATDGREAYGIDDRIPDFMLEWTQSSVPYSYGLVVEEEKQALISYASAEALAHADGNVYPDRALVLNYSDNSFSTYKLPIHCLGYSALESDVTWDDVTDAWEDIDWSWDEKALQAGYPTTLMGGHNGKIYQLNTGGADDGAAIEFQAIYGRWNPFVEQGKKARLGYIDFLVDVDPDVTFDVKSYLNTDSTPFQTKTVTCTAVDGSDDKAWHRVDVNAVGFTHRMELGNNAVANRPRVHAIVPWFEEAGQII